MGNVIKRLLATLLLVALFASFAVPATFADMENTVEAVEEYNIRLYNPQQDQGYNSWFTKTVAMTGVRDKISKAYEAGELNWKYINASDEANTTYRSEKGYFLRIKNKNNWVALQLRVPQAGRYSLTYTIDQTIAGTAANVTTYMFPAQMLTENTVDAISALMTEENNLGKQSLAGKDSVAFLPKEYEAGEYIAVFYVDALSFVGKLTLNNAPATEETTAATQTTTEAVTETTVESTEEPVTPPPSADNDAMKDGFFDMELYHYDAFSGLKGIARSYDNKYSGGGIVRDFLEDSYLNTVNWVLEGTSGPVPSIRGDVNIGMVTKTAANDWIAYRLNVTVTGNYSVIVNSNYPAYSFSADTWVFPTGKARLSAEEIQAAMTDENFLGKVKTSDTSLQSNVGNMEFTPGEYILVMRVNSGRHCMTSIALTEYVPEVPEEPVTPPPSADNDAMKDGFFDMELYHYDAFSGLKGIARSYDNKYSGGGIVRDFLEDSYLNTVNWVLEGTSGPVPSIRGDVNIGMVTKTAANDWIAYRLNVTVTGNYSVIVNSNYPAYSFSADTWVFPTGEARLSAEEIQAAMTDENFLGKVKTSDTSLQSNVGNMEFTPGEYILVMRVNSGRHCMTSIALTEYVPEVPKEPVEKITYDFNLVGIDPTFPQRGIANWADDAKTERVYVRIARMYQNDLIQWKYEGERDGTPVVNFRTNNMRFKSTTDYLELGKAWNAFRVEAPGAGVYDVRLTAVDNNTAVANIYLIPAKTGVSMTDDEIEAGMTSENLLISKARLSGAGTFYLGEYTFGTNNEYVLVLDFVRGSRLNLVKIEATKDGLVADGELPVGKAIPGVVYNLDLADAFEGVLTPYGESRYDFPDVFTQVQSRWDWGVQNWKWEYANEGLRGSTQETMDEPNNLTRFYKGSGLRIFGYKDSWMAIRIKSPGEGTFTVSINHATCNNSGTLALYVLPGDTAKEDIWAATDPENRLGKVVLTNETGEAVTKDGYTSFVGYWDFEAGKEYILVLECYEGSIYGENNICYVNVSQIFMEKGILEKETKEAEKLANPITVAENVIKVAEAGMHSAVTEVNGCDYYFVNLEGGTLLVYNLDTAELLDQVDIGIGYGRGMAVAPDGKIWMTGSVKKLVCYDPITMTVETSATLPGILGYNFSYTDAITVDENGIIYLTLSTCNVIRYDPVTKEITDLGRFVDKATYACALTYHKGYLYAHYYAPDVYSYVVKYDLSTNQVVAKTDVYEQTKENSVIFRPISIIDDSFMLCGSNANTEGALAIDIHTMEIIEVDLPGAINLGCSEEIDGKYYIVPQGYGLYEYDVATKTFSKVPGLGNSGTGFRSGAANSYGNTLVTIDGERCLFTYTTSGAHPRFFNLDTKEYISWDHLVYGVGGGSKLNSLCVGPEGSYDVYVTGWNTELGAIYNTQAGGITLEFETAGQSDSMQWYNGKFYIGNYSSTTLNETYPETNEIIQRFKLDHDLTGQLRPLTMTAGDDRVFVATVPYSNMNGGAVTVYNTITGEYFWERNVVQDQSIIGLAYHDGLIYCASSRGGGQGAPSMGDAAKIAVYDYNNHEVLATLDLRDYISGLAYPIDYIYELTADPVVEGRIWGVVSDTLFCFTFDRETKTFAVQEVLSYNKTAHRTSGAAAWDGDNEIQFDTERGYMYITFRNTGGFRRVELSDWNAPVGEVQVAEATRLMGYYTLGYMIADDGNLYFTAGGDLMMLPLNVTDEDWAIAEEVEALFDAIHQEEITLETESAIRTARSAYENLTWYYKALVQNLELLQEAESDILELKIADAVAENVEITADSYPQLKDLITEYKGLNSRQQRYVKNYETLKVAYDMASSLNDQRIAKAMQEKVDALQDLFPISLEEEPQVIAVREEFDALTGSQKLLVDTAILKEAEEQVKVAREQLVKDVEALIQAIPEDVTLAAEPAILAAREGVDKLYANERKQVSYTKLENAEVKLRSLKSAKEKADQVNAMISQIGAVTWADADLIHNARAAYNALDEIAKSMVTLEPTLYKAENILYALQTWAIPAAGGALLVLVFGTLCIIPATRKKIFKGKKKVSDN